MTKDQLISSFPEYSFNNLPWVIVPIVLAIFIIGLCLFLFRDDLPLGFRIGGPIAIIVVVGGMFFGIYAEASTKGNYELEKLDWKKENFYLKYLTTVEEERAKVNEYVLNSDGTVTVLIDTPRKEKRLTYISNVHYYAETQSTQGAYVKARWVEGLEDYEISTGFYDVNVYIPVAQKK